MTRAKALATAIAAATVSLAPPLPAAAQGVFVPPPGQRVQAPLTGIRASAADALREYGFRDVDARRLTTSQAATIHYVAYSDRSTGDKRALIRSALGRGLLNSLFSGASGVGVGRD